MSVLARVAALAAKGSESTRTATAVLSASRSPRTPTSPATYEAMPSRAESERPRASPPVRLNRAPTRRALRSEDHTSELQSRFDLVCRLLLEKKKNKI